MHRACIDRACVALRDEIIFAVRAGIGVSATMATIMIIPVVVIMMSMVVMFMIGIGHIRPSGVWLQCHS
ncbi:hypothetical protein HY36_06025 [Hyphomonas atlantica]|jgi:hypothetical protein|uniref:Uncharacterized protein n=1 Tax=Hyphomonas atlantica TaxID=1280948 RepID=A0A059E109_9PROT|nr:hypothetical protein HY36_06025 [Hyphomonas atlantica]RAN33302.1 hypothetical protein HY11_16775 [Hyphomonas pacifica]